ncbi:MAG: VCBS repeat-containing protein [Fidelibacterota bacterium]|nr:MAG: VCBS repeat-containing protein [Candidatus Neomarinimicrobiota bacterium]
MRPDQILLILSLPLLLLWSGACTSGNGSGDKAPVSFTRSTQEFSAVRTYQIALGDVDGDGDLDAALSNMGPNDSQVLLNDGSGRFTDSGQQLTQQGHGVGLADLDGDADLDLFITCANYEYTSKIYLNDGTGAFENHTQELDDRTLSGNRVTLFDLEGDGDLDAAIAYYLVPDSIYLNDGQGYFTGAGRVMPEDVSVADLDGDGHDDLFIKEFGQGYRTLMNDGTGQFNDHWQASDPDVIRGHVAFGDFNQDGHLDAFITNGDQTDHYPISIMLGDGTGSFVDTGQELSVTTSARPSLGDLNGDGHLDAFVSNFGEPNEVWLGDGTGHFEDSGLRLSGEALNTGGALGDLDGDGDLDIFVATFVDGPNEIWFNESH